MFTPLSSAITKIVGLQLDNVTKMLALQGITMDATSHAIAIWRKRIPAIGEEW
jgi:ATP-dependent Clp protease ATP-binding subunit ClpB